MRQSDGVRRRRAPFAHPLFKIGCFTLLVSACAGPQQTEAERSLSTVQADRGDIQRVVGASGKVVPREEVTVGSEVSGKVIEVLVDFNSQVKEGDVIARIDPTSYLSRVEQIQSRIDSALADIVVQNASIERTNVSLANAELQLTRREGLYAQEAISQAQLEAAQRDVGVSRADLKLAEARLKSSEASVKQLRAQLDEARADLDRTTIRSPIDGVIIDRKVDPGQTVQASFNAPELFAIAADLSEITVDASVVESDVAGLEAGDKASFTVDAYPDDPVDGVVSQLRLKSTEQNNIVSYIAVIDAQNPNGMLLPGMTANLRITTETRPGVMRLPASVERFRPSPEDIAAFQSEGEVSEETSLLEPTYARLRSIGMADARVAQFAEQTEAATQKVRDVINDPSQPWMHARMRTQLAELVESKIRTFLDADERRAYAAKVSEERTIRPVDLWVANGDGTMSQRTVRLGLSDGSFVEVVSGLEQNDRVVIGVRESGGGSGGGRPGGRPGA